VVLSAHDDVGRLVEAVRLGAVDYVVKPVAILNLIEHLPIWLKAAAGKVEGRPTASY
jgi:response regulator of citrate/malate metabolism